jgi:hypothetical protein
MSDCRSSDSGYTITKLRYEERMKPLQKRSARLHVELSATLDAYVNLFASSHDNPDNWFGVLCNQIEHLASRRNESPQRTVDWLFRKLKDPETFMKRLQDIVK